VSRVKMLFWTLVVLILFVMFGASNPDFEGMAEARQKFASQDSGDITIVALQDVAKSDYLKGIQLAAEHVNDRPGKLLGRELDVRIEQDGTNFENRIR